MTRKKSHSTAGLDTQRMFYLQWANILKRVLGAVPTCVFDIETGSQLFLSLEGIFVYTTEG